MRWVLASLALVVSSVAHGSLVATFDVGAGRNASNLQFDFANGNSYLYIVHWDGAMTGRGMFDVAAAAQPAFFSFITVQFPFGEALFNVSIGSDANEGFGTPPDYFDYWHYWTRESDAEPWGYAQVGFADRIVSNGSWDGWVFGSNDAPAPVPGPGVFAVLALGATLMSRRRR